MKYIVKFSDNTTGIYSIYSDMTHNIEQALLEGVTVDSITDTDDNRYNIDYIVTVY